MLSFNPSSATPMIATLSTTIPGKPSNKLFNRYPSVGR